jgi:hypothetical protein
MKKIRDLTQAQFDAYVKKFGFEPTGFMGYYSLPKPNNHTQVSKFNAGDNRRAHLAYLIAQAKRYEKEKAA